MNILTFDIEEWFHVLEHDSTKTANEWHHYESRIHGNMERIFEVLDDVKLKATFFCLGWIAEKYPKIVKEITARGYEVGTHTAMHQLIYEQGPGVFGKDIEYSIKTLEDIAGKKIRCFRAPGFSLREDNKWAFEVLTDLGIEIDSSIFPAQRAHGGFPSYKEPFPSILKYNGITLKELPINYASVFGKPVIYSGGGYFRLFPYPLIKYWTNKTAYVMTYFHPRDFDPGQPVIKDLSFMRKFKSYVGLSGAFNKFRKLINDFDFIDIAEADKMIDWGRVPVVNIGSL
ncbi:MAG: polysaccharide deacetylase family protein [Treponema sp.]|jgi:polysaccharide deacetylase family protein (PEP-CTERM system associated)|nr:polysaccharide deacetylase family protein [Treponema sp.]